MANSLCVNIGNLKLSNPVLVASGTFGYAQEFAPYLDLKKLGGITTKTITLHPRRGNPPPRIIETAAGMLNSIGLQNEGVKNFLKEKLPYLKKIGIPVIVSIGGDTIDEYVALAKILNKEKGVVALELNISCPNIKGKEILIAQDNQATSELVKKVRAVFDKTIITKLSPNVTEIVLIAKAAEEAGSDAISLINTFFGMAVDIETKKSKLANNIGGLSGPAIKPIALRMVWQVARSIDIPVIGMGGIMNANDAMEFMIAGATAICLGTANLIDPSSSIKIIKGIEDYLKKNKIKDIKKLIGCINNQ